MLIFDVIERVPQVRNSSNPSSRISLTRAINFTNVTFKYPTSLPEHKPVLIDASFSIRTCDGRIGWEAQIVEASSL